jgi:glutaminyl-tRNA synthetase
VCFQKSEEIEVCREVAKKHAQARSKGIKPGDAEWPEGDPCSPYRETSVEENLKLFNDMKLGKFDEGVACLRMKMDMTSSNLNMFDQVAYRVKYVGHPHIGDEWCIYPTYDFTHCVQDALEDIDFSICTLEFETRRESYYWLLHHLNLFKPMVYEMVGDDGLHAARSTRQHAAARSTQHAARAA